MKPFQSITFITILVSSVTLSTAYATQLPSPPACGTSIEYKNNPQLPATDPTAAQLDAANKALKIPAASTACTQEERSIYLLMSETCRVASIKTQGNNTGKIAKQLINNCRTFYNQWLDDSAAKSTP